MKGNFQMKQVDSKITIKELEQMAIQMSQNLVKAVVDINKEIMVVDADLHANQELYLLEQNSTQDDLWGINVHPENYDSEDWIEFDSMINLRPSRGNRSRGVDNIEMQQKIRNIVNKLVSS